MLQCHHPRVGVTHPILGVERPRRSQTGTWRVARREGGHVAAAGGREGQVDRGPAGPKILFTADSAFNGCLSVIEVPDHPDLCPSVEELKGFRVLILDESGNIHSLWKEDQFLTNSYWDFMTTLPQFMQQGGTIGILGLGAGTVARMVAHHYPGTRMEGWEIDPAVVEAARRCFKMGELEAEGSLVVHVDDALQPSASRWGGFNAIMVDLFHNGHVLDVLTEVEAWKDIRAKLEVGTGARVMANLGLSPIPLPGWPVHEDAYYTVKALDCMLEVFGGEVNVLHIRNMDGPQTMNTLALTGSIEGLQNSWVSGMPDALKHLGQDYSWEKWTKSETHNA